MKPTLPVRRVFDSEAPTYVKITTPDGIVGIKLSGNRDSDAELFSLADTAEGYGISGYRPQVIIRKAKP